MNLIATYEYVLNNLKLRLSKSNSHIYIYIYLRYIYIPIGGEKRLFHKGVPISAVPGGPANITGVPKRAPALMFSPDSLRDPVVHKYPLDCYREPRRRDRGHSYIRSCMHIVSNSRTGLIIFHCGLLL